MNVHDLVKQWRDDTRFLDDLLGVALANELRKLCAAKWEAALAEAPVGCDDNQCDHCYGITRRIRMRPAQPAPDLSELLAMADEWERRSRLSGFTVNQHSQELRAYVERVQKGAAGDA